ncbi:MAG: hypothetical protein ACI88G_000832 [Woeseiaceae bacterium]|jgi:hypothetical protein
MLTIKHHCPLPGHYYFPRNVNFATPQQLNMKRFFNWLTERFLDEDDDEEMSLRPSAVHVSPKPKKKRKVAPPAVEFSSEMEGKIEDGGPGKNVLVRNKYLREDTGTHESLKIVDDSIIESGDEDGLDPYNTGRFDRSKSWDSFRSRK